MDENPYKAPDERCWTAQGKPRQQSTIDPFWSQLAHAVFFMAVFFLPIWIGLAIYAAAWIFD